MINNDNNKILLVKNSNGEIYDFPKGKQEVNDNEEECAIREVKEETDYDIWELVKRNEYIKVTTKEGMRIKLFVIRGVDEEFKFQANTINEISSIKFKSVDSIIMRLHKPRYVRIQPFMYLICKVINESAKTYPISFKREIKFNQFEWAQSS